MNLNNVEFVLSAAKPAHYPPADRPEVAFAGRSNVGKSSLLNTLLNRRGIARVSRTPGRTQMINFFDVDEALYLVDLPGYGFAKVPESVRRQWGPMMERYVRSRETLCAMVVLLDVRREPNREDLQLMDSLCALEIPMIPVMTKCDKLSKSQLFKRRAAIARAASLPTDSLIAFSSHTGAGRGELWATIEAAIEEPEAGELVGPHDRGSVDASSDDDDDDGGTSAP